jgi:hypothetical protein
VAANWRELAAKWPELAAKLGDRKTVENLHEDFKPQNNPATAPAITQALTGLKSGSGTGRRQGNYGWGPKIFNGCVCPPYGLLIVSIMAIFFPSKVYFSIHRLHKFHNLLAKYNKSNLFTFFVKAD